MEWNKICMTYMSYNISVLSRTRVSVSISSSISITLRVERTGYEFGNGVCTYFFA